MKKQQLDDKSVCVSLYEQALDAVRTTRRASLSFLQRRLNIGYQEAARLIDLLEERGVVGSASAKGPRKILIKDS